jgi:uncharacterized protein (TIGR02246 family)
MTTAPAKPARSPEDVHLRFVEAFNARDLEALLALFEPGACLVPQPGAPPVSGRPAIRAALAPFLALGGSMAITPRRVLLAGDVALLLSPWTLRATGPDGRPVEMAGRTTDVVRLQPDGSWRLAIDNPFGVD